MVFVGIYTALYDYAPQGENELAIQEGELLYVLDKSTEDDWWKAKKRAAADEEEEPTGLIPSNYVEEVSGSATHHYERGPEFDTGIYYGHMGASICYILDLDSHGISLETFANRSSLNRPSRYIRPKLYLITLDKQLKSCLSLKMQFCRSTTLLTLIGRWWGRMGSLALLRQTILN